MKDMFRHEYVKHQAEKQHANQAQCRQDVINSNLSVKFSQLRFFRKASFQLVMMNAVLLLDKRQRLSYTLTQVSEHSSDHTSRETVQKQIY